MFKYLLFLSLSITSANACVVLVYHHFDTTTPKSTSINPRLFEQHLQYIKNNNFTVLRLKDLVKKIKNKEPLPKKCVALTTDDAYTSIATNAYPLLKKYNISMSVFVATEAIDKKYGAFMSYEQMQKTLDYIDYYNHSYSHKYLYTLDKNTLQTNITKAQNTLKNQLNTQEKIFAYPYGEFDAKTYDVIKQMGYSAFGQHSGAINLDSDLHNLPRFPMTDFYGKMSSFKTKINTLAFEVENIEPISQIAKTNPPTLQIQFKQRYDLSCFVKEQKPPIIKWNKLTATITAQKPINKGRTKYNCTAPSEQKGRFYWVSKQWVVL